MISSCYQPISCFNWEGYRVDVVPIAIPHGPPSPISMLTGNAERKVGSGDCSQGRGHKQATTLCNPKGLKSAIPRNAGKTDREPDDAHLILLRQVEL